MLRLFKGLKQEMRVADRKLQFKKQSIGKDEKGWRKRLEEDRTGSAGDGSPSVDLKGAMPRKGSVKKKQLDVPKRSNQKMTKEEELKAQYEAKKNKEIERQIEKHIRKNIAVEDKAEAAIKRMDALAEIVIEVRQPKTKPRKNVTRAYVWGFNQHNYHGLLDSADPEKAGLDEEERRYVRELITRPTKFEILNKYSDELRLK